VKPSRMRAFGHAAHLVHEPTTWHPTVLAFQTGKSEHDLVCDHRTSTGRLDEAGCISANHSRFRFEMILPRKSVAPSMLSRKLSKNF